MLLPRMPLQHDYKVIFMTRPIQEVVASQRQMVNRLGKKAAELDPEQLQRGLTAHREETLLWLATAPHMKFIEIDYPALVRDPQSIVSRLVQFLGAEQLPNETVMAAVVDPLLHRQKR
jgi:LPS sulfotransferase NodH